MAKKQKIAKRKNILFKKNKSRPPKFSFKSSIINFLKKSEKNPIIAPIKENEWESVQTFNPAAFYEDGRVHLLYRALGSDGVSRIGYALSENGIDIVERLDEPIFTYLKQPVKDGKSLYNLLEYNSGGGWNGSEDPRVTVIDDRVYMFFVAFDGWDIPRLAITSISLDDFLNRKWKWDGVKIISPPGIVDKSGVVFPEKIRGKYVVMHRIFPNILIDFVNDLDFEDGEYLPGKYSIKVRSRKFWDSRKIGAGAPPIKTKKGWLLIYYGVDDKDARRYMIGAMLLDLHNPVKVLVRTDEPILEPTDWYENEGHKAGIAYPCGAVVMSGTLFVYYGGADTVVCVATANLETFLDQLINKEKPKLKTLKPKKTNNAKS